MKDDASSDDGRAEALLRVASSEGEEEELLDEIAVLERRIRRLRGEAAESAEAVRRTRRDIDATTEELAALDEAVQRDLADALERDVEPDADEERTLAALIEAKTKLAQVTEARERAHLERKKLEDQLAKAKFAFADAITDEES